MEKGTKILETLTARLKAPWVLRAPSGGDEGKMLNVLGRPAMADIDHDALATAVNAATADERGETPYVIWSNEHRGWWAPNRCGYTGEIENAGCYSRREALNICYDAGPSSLHLRPAPLGCIPAEIMMRLEDARASTLWHRGNQEVTDRCGCS